jgi:hypothetical protein
MTQSVKENEEDLTTLLFMLCGGAATGMFSFGVILIPIRVWMVQHSLLASGGQVVIPFVDGIGLGWAQIVVIAGLLALLLTLIVWTRRRRSRDRV